MPSTGKGTADTPLPHPVSSCKHFPEHQEAPPGSLFSHCLIIRDVVFTYDVFLFGHLSLSDIAARCHQADMDFLVYSMDEFNVYDRRMLASVLTTMAPWPWRSSYQVSIAAIATLSECYSMLWCYSSPLLLLSVLCFTQAAYFDNDARMRLLHEMRVASVSVSTYASERNSKSTRSDRVDSDESKLCFSNVSAEEIAQNVDAPEPGQDLKDLNLEKQQRLQSTGTNCRDSDFHRVDSAPLEASNQAHFEETIRTMEI